MNKTEIDKLQELLTHSDDAFFNQGLALLETANLSAEEVYRVFGIDTNICSFGEIAMLPQFMKYSFTGGPSFWADSHRILNIIGYFAKFGVTWTQELSSLRIPDLREDSLPTVLQYLQNHDFLPQGKLL